MKKLILCLFLVLGAWSWRTPNSTFYMMNSDNLSPVSSRKINIAVSRVKVPDLLDRPQIVTYKKSSDEIQINEFERWGEVFPDVVQSTITNDLMAMLPNAFIKRAYLDSQSMNYSVNVEINKMAAYRDDKVILSAWWNIMNSSGRILKRGQETFEVKVKGSSMRDLVEAQAQAIHQLSEVIATNLSKGI